MSRHRLFNLLLAAAGVAVWLLLGAALDGPSDLDTLQATEASVQDAEQSATVAQQDQP